MYNIKYSNEAFENVNNFIIYLRNYYKKIYFDTGIINEYQIVLNYVEKTNELFDEIINNIENTINKGVFGVILESNNEYILSKLVIHIRSYSIVIIIEKRKDIYIKSIFIN